MRSPPHCHLTRAADPGGWDPGLFPDAAAAPAFHRAPGRGAAATEGPLWPRPCLALGWPWLLAPLTSAGSVPSVLPGPGDVSLVQVAALSPGPCSCSLAGVLAPDTWPAQPIRLTSTFLENLVVPLTCLRPLVPVWSHFCVLLHSAVRACLSGAEGRPLGSVPMSLPSAPPAVGASAQRLLETRGLWAQEALPALRGCCLPLQTLALGEAAHAPPSSPVSAPGAASPCPSAFPCRTGAVRGPAPRSLMLPWPAN